MDVESLSEAFSSTRSVLANVKPDQLDDTTPCRSWTVRQLVDHFIAAPYYGVGLLETGVGGETDEDFSAGDYLAAYDATRQMTLDAFRAEGALEKTLPFPFGDIPAAFFLVMVTGDQFVHGWDLARATGQPSDLNPALAERLLQEAVIPDQFRGPEGAAPFGPEQPASPDAPAADRFAAYTGRTV
ncbi:MAG TPA: TIGR03086 family metal-binding protein [Acidimicrobiales bacterium]|nr:TIGR03086 family metal-binding protein [Acidimicrobiales bacterium]